MKGTKFQALIRKHLQPKMPELAVSRWLLFVHPLHYILRGYCFEGSGYDPAMFYVWVFVQPLFVPARGVVFNLGDRLGSIRGKQSESWTLTDNNEEELMADVYRLMKREGPMILDKFKTLEDFIKNAITRHTNPHSPYPPEMVAYGAVLLGNRRLAQKMFNRLEETLHPEQEYCAYHAEIRDRARLIRDAFARNPGEAVTILNGWREETAANLKLTEYLEPVGQHL